MRHVLALTVLVAAFAASAPAFAAASLAGRSADAWQEIAGSPPPSRNGAGPEVRPRRFRALKLNRAELADVLGAAPRERTPAARSGPLTISLPAPDGRFRRFAIQRTSVMEPALAAEHPEIATYSGTGIDDRGATVRLDLTPVGFHASVRGPSGSWYVDPYYRREQSVYVSYRRADLANPHGRLVEEEVLAPPQERAGEPARALAAEGAPVQLRTYRFALVSDPAYATYHGAANVTAAKVTLVNRVNQIYEDDLAIRLSLVAGNDLLNLNTAAQMTGANGPCGAAPCYSTLQAQRCDVDTLDRTRVVLGQLIGASNYDVGHIGMGVNGGGIAYLGVAGDDLKGGGCTGVSKPVGDLFAIDYVAHEIGHQFAGNHTYNGVDGACGANIAGTSVEPGSATTVMGYAGICDSDDLQPHTDPYFSQRSIDEVASYVARAPAAVDEVQTVSLRGFDGTDSFRLTYNGAQSATITRGTNYSAAGIAAAITGIAGIPAGATVSVRSWDGASSSLSDDTGFSVTFRGSLAGSDVASLTLSSAVGTTGFTGETAQGGTTRNGGSATTLANRTPVVEAPAAFTIPTRTPFSLTGSGSDADGDALVYLWEQNNAGSGTSLVANTKSSGPLFRVFGTAAAVTEGGALLSPSPGANAAGTSPTRVFPDMAQILAGNTNAATGACPAAPASQPVPAGTLDCYSEFLPTSSYASTLRFRLTARDTNAAGGGVAHADTTLTLAKTAGPFRVTSQASATTVAPGAPLAVAWTVAGTDAAPVSTANVKITLSTDGGRTFATVLSESTPNDGAAVVTLPNVNTTSARIKVEAVGNVFFDVNHADFTIAPGAPVVTDDAPAGGATAQYSDALAQTVTISASDPDSPGSALSAVAAGLPSGLALSVATTSAGGRTWAVGGEVRAAPGTYRVAVTVSDDGGRTGATSFDVVVSREDGTVTYTGDTLVSGAAGAGEAAVKLSANVLDSSAAPGASDATRGDVATATVSFRQGATTLCTAPVTTAGDGASGAASCTASLATGATHRVDAVLGGRYAGSGAGDVEVRKVAAMTTTPPPPPPAPVPPAPVAPLPSPAAATLAPSLARVPARLRVSRTGRAAVRVGCRTIGFSAARATCRGTLRLTMKINGRRLTIGTARFSFARTASKTVWIRLSARARRALRTVRSATLRASVPNAGSATRTATKIVRLVPPRR